MKKHLCFTLLLFTTCATLYAESKVKDPIDIALEKAQETVDTLGLVEANREAERKWQKEIDLAITKLEKVMKPEQGKAIQAAQKAWEAYRDKELEALMEIYSAMPGTRSGPAHTQRQMRLTKERALFLRDQLEEVTDGKILRVQ